MFELPPLPDIFGNYSIKGIEEIIKPEPLSWLPTTTGWQLLAIAVLVAALWQSHLRYQHWLRNRYRKLARAQLQLLVATQGYQTSIVPALNRLLKTTALQGYRRQEIAGLSGQAWAQWLNQQTSAAIFSTESCLIIAADSYRKTREIPERQLRQLVTESQRWVAEHSGQKNA